MTGVLAVMVSMGGPRVSFGNIDIEHTTGTPADATAGLRFESDGDISYTGDGSGGAYVDMGDWINPKAAAGANYEIRVTLISGTFTSGTIDTWEALSSNRTWTAVRTGLGTKTVSFTLEIRHATTLVVLDSSTCSLTAIEAA